MLLLGVSVTGKFIGSVAIMQGDGDRRYYHDQDYLVPYHWKNDLSRDESVCGPGFRRKPSQSTVYQQRSPLNRLLDHSSDFS